MTKTTATTQQAVAISVRGVSKRFTFTKPSGNAVSGAFGAEEKDFSALKDINFDLMRGDIVGVVGSNGSGKTTLLKILSSITKPSSGEVRIYGRSTSILDIGSNFHPDLTGRENTRMHLRLSGVDKSKQPELIDKILQFSGIAEFFDQPVKYYSQGMFLRLAFSVVFNLAADILILDEVLSVGDENFRMKCFNHIKLLRNKGYSILFVSHSRNEILEIATKCIWLDKGTIRQVGMPSEVLGNYFEYQKSLYEDDKRSQENTAPLENMSGNDGVNLQWQEADAPGNDLLSVRRLWIGTRNGDIGNIYTDEPIVIKVLINKKVAGVSICSLISLQDVFNQPAVLAYNLNNTDHIDFADYYKDETGLLEFTCEVPANLVCAGTYYVLFRFGRDAKMGESFNEEAFSLERDVRFQVRDKPGNFDFIGSTMNGAVRPQLKWSYTKQAGE